MDQSLTCCVGQGAWVAVGMPSETEHRRGAYEHLLDANLLKEDLQFGEGMSEGGGECRGNVIWDRESRAIPSGFIPPESPEEGCHAMQAG